MDDLSMLDSFKAKVLNANAPLQIVGFVANPTATEGNPPGSKGWTCRRSEGDKHVLIDRWCG